MVDTYLPLLILLLAVAALMRDDFSLTLIYLLVGAFLLSVWWSRRALGHVILSRQFAAWAFLGEKVNIRLDLRNKGWLPVLWMRIQENLPVGLSSVPAFEHVTTLGPREETQVEYVLEARKRGCYPIGPLFATSGDIFGLGGTARLEGGAQTLTVYPRIIPLTSIDIPSQSPQGTLRHTQPIFEDPTRILGKRDYAAGDSLRRVDWKSTATTGRMQVKIFEPSIALETLIFLNLNADDYYYQSRIDSTELAIVIAASVAAWVAGKQQTVGLKVNGRDALAVDSIPQYLPPRRGRTQLMHILEALARVEMTQESSFSAMIRQQRYHLSWGTSLLVISGGADISLLDELHQARRAGQNVLLILAGKATRATEVSQRAGAYGIPVVSFYDERSLELWRG
jgi:uncharacterized protein (DUF58 family)